MAQVRYHIAAGKAEAERLYAALDAAFEDEGAPVAISEVDEAAERFEVSAYLEVAEGEDRTSEVAAALGRDTTDGISREDLPDRDWMADVLAALKPVRAGRFIVHGAHDRDKVAANDLSIEIEAGQAFGTGHHGTTAGCLSAIGRIVGRRRPRNALDLGTGSAVLAIGIAKLARVKVLATDIDPVAVRVAAANIAGNGVAPFVETAVATGFRARAIADRAPYDLIVANILAGPLMRLAPEFARHLARGGDLILSGILASQRDRVLASFRIQGLYHRQTLVRGEWVTLHLTR
ncbi:50S ribosomal protein L11 methyltransferase [Aurantimonas endophytica]|uniref:Ribosomal protein L11 methyltransferase n=1 Tax=Aurantimonas endophytica TaxID=1522175 RepID=A0A7W6HBT0_9HYPH|nr:50S ribosomal protein L11 methyltransferase [Aurantimonas endophytica]MBB4002276.1 ribosomal protein L11 methyltransferase [Aurantimonas endophytica]MCO6402100.1 50S ribosomal protein L11 methyltransferase [Aurantimonas endophytica]